MTLATIAAGVTPAIAWDSRSQGLWRAGIDTPPDLTVSFVPLGEDASGRVVAVQPVEDGAVAVGVGVWVPRRRWPWRDTTVFRLDLAASRLSSGTSVAGYGTVVLLAVAEPTADFVVVREPSASKAEPASYSLLRVHHRNIP
jgi:hypothetical protein